jgi:hypothetical protein
MAEGRETFLQRWARRKAEQRDPATPEAAPTPAEEGRQATATEAVAADQLPAIDDLTAESDFTAFLKEGVPEELKRLALRKLWRTDPVFANLDGLLEYGDDFAAQFRNPGVVATLFRLGQGMPAADRTSDGKVVESPEAALPSDTQAGGVEDASKEVENDPSKVTNDPDNDPGGNG